MCVKQVVKLELPVTSAHTKTIPNPRVRREGKRIYLTNKIQTTGAESFASRPFFPTMVRKPLSGKKYILFSYLVRHKYDTP